MSAVLMRSLALLALAPLASCELYFRDDEVADDDVPPDGGVIPDAFVSPDATPDIDAGPPPPPPNPGFVAPTSTTRANSLRNGQWQDVGPADWSCLANPPAEVVPDGGYTLSGTVRDFANNSGVGGATIAATANGEVLANGTSSTGTTTRGQYRLDLRALPNGATRVRFAVTTMTSRNTITIDRYLGQFGFANLDLPVMSEQTATALPAFVGETVDASAGLVVGEVRDCQGRSVSGAILALSTSPTFVSHWPGGNTFYFSAGNTSLPVRHETRTQTAADGRFMIIGAIPNGAEATVQAYGYPTEADQASGALKPVGKSAAVIESRTASVVLLGRPRGFAGTP